ncbi:hypothetical protein DPMN_148596 [Dreissena polymorpha]|uniref:Uncharacterized protein n=1 Tax=Dreissena polymorpha TaxID=45954 RepID=A0A9D4J0D0_DREPO|nr:hypothetical protein DPMN_148596 [Dreissena polymorpha]
MCLKCNTKIHLLQRNFQNFLGEDPMLLPSIEFKPSHTYATTDPFSLAIELNTLTHLCNY